MCIHCYRENGYEPLKTLRRFFNYHFIAADGTIEDVRKRVEKEFQYQSSLELQDNTYELLETLPRAEDLTKFYRQNLVKDLDEYQVRLIVVHYVFPARLFQHG